MEWLKWEKHKNVLWTHCFIDGICYGFCVQCTIKDSWENIVSINGSKVNEIKDKGKYSNIIVSEQD